MSFCQFFEPAVGGSFRPFRQGRRAGQLPLFSGPSAKGGVPGGRSRLAALDPTVHCRSRSPLLRCRGWHGLRPSHHLRPPLLLHPRPFAAVCQGGTGDPRLPSHTKSTASQAPPSPGWHIASYRPGTPCHPSPLPPPEPASLATSPLPSTKKPYLVDEMPFCLRHPQKRLFWWMNRHY